MWLNKWFWIHARPYRIEVETFPIGAARGTQATVKRYDVLPGTSRSAPRGKCQEPNGFHGSGLPQRCRLFRNLSEVTSRCRAIVYNLSPQIRLQIEYINNTDRGDIICELDSHFQAKIVNSFLLRLLCLLAQISIIRTTQECPIFRLNKHKHVFIMYDQFNFRSILLVLKITVKNKWTVDCQLWLVPSSSSLLLWLP